MAWLPDATDSLTEQMLTYNQLDHKKHIWIIFYLKYVWLNM